jgi:PAS domain S-box-containing protein
VRDEDGMPTGMIGISTDITERKRAEEALAASEANYRAIFDAANDAFFIHDPDSGRILDVNEKTCAMVGYSREELKSLTVGDISSRDGPYTDEHALRWIRRAVEEGPQTFEWHIRRRTGECLWVEVNLKSAVIGGQKRILALARDITERKEAEDALRDSEARLRLIMQQMPAVLWTVDRNLRFTSSDGRGLGRLGHRPGEMVGVSLQEYFRTDDPDALPIRAHRRALEGESMSYQIDWAGCSFDTHVEPLRDGEGRIIGAIGTAHDVTERRQAEQEARQRAETEQLLLRELDHRVRNNLSSLISLIDMAGRSTKDVATFSASVTSRVRAIATAHALLSTAQWQRVRLRSLITAMVVGERGRAVHLEGPPIEIPAAQVQAVGIIVNELMTNSHKHGALSISEGRLNIRWELFDDDDEHSRRLVIHWHESGGPHIEQTPDRGVGLELVEGLVRSELRGQVDFQFAADGARHRIEIRLDDPETSSS